MNFAKWLLGREEEEELGMFMGAQAAGKTAILYRLLTGENVTTTIPTNGFNLETIKHGRRRFTMWDLGGGDRIRPLTRCYLRKEMFYIFVHDCSSSATMEYSLETLHVMLNMIRKTGGRHLFLVFTKQDLLPSDPKQRQDILANLKVRFDSELKKYEGLLPIEIIDIPGLSATTGEGCDSLVEHIARALDHTKRLRPRATVNQPTSVDMLHISNEELLDNIKVTNAKSENAELFWASFLSGQLSSWGHYEYLRAGYFVLCETSYQGSGVMKSAEVYAEHLERLKESQMPIFKNTSPRRTMTIFWILQLEIAAESYRTEHNTHGIPSRTQDFGQILLRAPHLMIKDLWRKYYTPDSMFSQRAIDSWVLPDIQKLPLFVDDPQQSHSPPYSPSTSDPLHNLRFAFTVAQKSFSTNLRREAFIRQELATLQTTTMRSRAKQPSLPPYSETQAYFWIQFVHAALESFRPESNSEADSRVSTDKFLANLSFTSFAILFGVTGAEWRQYYSAKLWNSISSRIAFVNPDIKPLPNVISLVSDNQGRDSPSVAPVSISEKLADLPSDVEDLINSLEFEAIDMEAELKPLSPRATLLCWLYDHIGKGVDKLQAEHQDTETNLESITNSAAHNITNSETPGLTHRLFWAQQVLFALTRTEAQCGVDDFERFMRQNAHLAYEDLPYVYYSPEVWESSNALQTYVPPDRRPLPKLAPKKYVCNVSQSSDEN